MTVSFLGTYTTDNGDSIATGTVAITPLNPAGETVTATLDAAGSYETDGLTGTDFSVVETINGTVLTSEVRCIDGVGIDTSKNVGGGTVYADTVATLTVLGYVTFAGIPTADPHVVGELWANDAVLTVSAG